MSPDALPGLNPARNLGGSPPSGALLRGSQNCIASTHGSPGSLRGKCGIAQTTRSLPLPLSLSCPPGTAVAAVEADELLPWGEAELFRVDVQPAGGGWRQ